MLLQSVTYLTVLSRKFNAYKSALVNDGNIHDFDHKH